MCRLPDDFTFSFTSLSLFEQCPAAFKLRYIDGMKDEGNFFSDYGSHMHRLLQRYEEGKIPFYLLAEAYDSEYTDAVTHFPPPYPKGMAEKYYQAGLDYFNSFSGFGDDEEILSVEDPFHIEVEGNRLTGLADLVLKNKKTGGITVIDHKTKSATSMKKEHETFRYQLYIYAMFVHEKWGVWPEKLVFNGVRDTYWIEEPFDESMVEKTRQWILSVIERIRSEEEFPCRFDRYYCFHLCGVSFQCPKYREERFGEGRF